MDPLKAFRDRLSRLSQLSIDELTALDTELVAAFDAADKGENGPDVDLMDEIAGELDNVRAEGQARTDSQSSTEEIEETPEQVAASAARERVGRPSLAEIQARRPRSNDPKPAGSSSVSGADLASRLQHAARDLAFSRRGGRALVASYAIEYPEDRRLTSDDAGRNRARIDSLVASIGDFDAIVAAGGLCAPTDVRYEIDVLANLERPIRDALVRVAAPRGGIQFSAPPRLAQIDGAVNRYTEAQDASGAEYPKSIQRVVCPDYDEVTVDAITSRLEAGNFQRKFNSEQVDAWWALALTAQARLAENTLWDGIADNSTAVVTGLDAATELGTARRLLRAVALAVEGLRDRHRLPDSKAIRAIAPRSLRANIREDLAAQVPGDNRYAVADAEIAEFFSRRGVVVTWSPDAGGQVIGNQAAGALNPWPDIVELLLFPEGTHAFLDGGELNFGLEIRDSSLNEQNDVEMFTETFEATAKFGAESLALSVDICASGRSSEPVAYNPCASGS